MKQTPLLYGSSFLYITGVTSPFCYTFVLHFRNFLHSVHTKVSSFNYTTNYNLSATLEFIGNLLAFDCDCSPRKFHSSGIRNSFRAVFSIHIMTDEVKLEDVLKVFIYSIFPSLFFRLSSDFLLVPSGLELRPFTYFRCS